MAAPGYADLLQSRNLLPLPMTGTELDAFVKKGVADYRALATDSNWSQSKAREP